MNIKLIQSGGITGKKMTAVTSSKLTAKEWDELAAAAKKTKSNLKMRDAIHYTIQKEGEDDSKTVIDPDAIPEKHEELFKKLFDKLKPEA